jgi:hypothetical protein
MNKSETYCTILDMRSDASFQFRDNGTDRTLDRNELWVPARRSSMSSQRECHSSMHAKNA